MSFDEIKSSINVSISRISFIGERDEELENLDPNLVTVLTCYSEYIGPESNFITFWFLYEKSILFGISSKNHKGYFFTFDDVRIGEKFFNPYYPTNLERDYIFKDPIFVLRPDFTMMNQHRDHFSDFEWEIIIRYKRDFGIDDILGN